MERYSYLTISKEALADKNISLTSRLLLAQLLDHHNKKTGQCNPKRRTLARELGVSVATIKRHLNKLRGAGLIASKQGQYTNNYEVWPLNPGGSKRPSSGGSYCTPQEGQNDPPEPPVSLYEPSQGEPKRRTAAAAAIGTYPEEQSQQQQRTRSEKEFPKTAEAIRESYPDAEDAFVCKVATEAVKCAGSANGAPLLEEPTDAVIADAVRHCRRDNQTSAGLFLRTVPQCVKTWCTRGRTAAAERKQPMTAFERGLVLVRAKMAKEKANGS